jgi:hypothetical protein
MIGRFVSLKSSQKRATLPGAATMMLFLTMVFSSKPSAKIPEAAQGVGLFTMVFRYTRGPRSPEGTSQEIPPGSLPAMRLPAM